MRYWGGGIGHQNEGLRWKIADRGTKDNEMDIDSEPEEDNQINLPHTDDLTQLSHLNHIAGQLPEDGDTDSDLDSNSSHSSDSTSIDNPLDYGTDDDGEDRSYFGPEDDQQIFDFDSDG